MHFKCWYLLTSAKSLQASIRRRLPDRDIMLSVGLVVGGCIIAGIGDFEFNLRGCLPLLLPQSNFHNLQHAFKLGRSQNELSLLLRCAWQIHLCFGQLLPASLVPAPCGA